MSSARNAIEARLGRVEFIVLMSVLMALTALAIDMMLPAFGDMRSTFGLEPDSNAVAPVVTVFLLGIGLGQPLWGPLSDSLGRKRIIWIGLAIYALGAVGAAFAPSLGVLLVWRFLSGFGAGAVRVATLGVLRDAYAGEQMAKVLSYIMAVFILVPTIAPSIGAVVLAFGSWRVIFAVFVACALLAGLWATRLPETLPQERRIALNLATLAGAAKAVVTSRFAMGLTIARMAVFAFFASYLASSQVIIDDVFELGDWFPLILGGGPRPRRRHAAQPQAARPLRPAPPAPVGPDRLSRSGAAVRVDRHRHWWPATALALSGGSVPDPASPVVRDP